MKVGDLKGSKEIINQADEFEQENGILFKMTCLL